MEIALIGLSGSGKTTLFDALTGASRKGEPSPGSVGQGRVGVTKIPDARLDALAAIFSPKKVTPAEITYWDTPSTVTGGGIEGRVLNLLQQADAFIHVVRAFDNPAAPHPSGSVDPMRDVKAMASELALADMVILEGRLQRVADGMKGARGRDRDLLLREQTLLHRVQQALEEGRPIAYQSLTGEESNLLSNYNLLTAKPTLAAYNIGEEGLPGGEGFLPASRERAGQGGLKEVVLCGKLEWELAQLPPEGQQEFREALGVTEPGVDLLIKESLSLLRMVAFFTFVSEEARGWTVPQDAPAPAAAGKIHSDMERGFIRAEVVSFDDMVACGSIAEARRRGALRSEGKGYRVQDGDVITFLFRAPR